MMDRKQEILDLPRWLRATFEKGRAEYEALVRQTRWGDGPLFVVGSGSSRLVGLTGAYAFESMLGWPVIVRAPGDFTAYSLAVLRPRAILLAISQSGENVETLEAARAARARGATLLALTSNLESSLAAIADGVFHVPAGERQGFTSRIAVCQHAALSFIALVAAQALKRHHPQLAAVEAEFEKLPEHIEWVLTQMPDAVRSFAGELRGLEYLAIVGGGFYHPVALQWELSLSRETGMRAAGFSPEEFTPRGLLRREGDGAVFLSSSRCRLKKAVNQLAAKAAKERLRVLSITDRNDRELASRCALGILLPTLSEMVGFSLTLALLEWVTCHLRREREPQAAKDRPSPDAPRGERRGT